MHSLEIAACPPVLLDRLTRARTRDNDPAQGAVAVTDAQVAELRSALAYLRADDRDLWVAVGHALAELGAVGRGLWLDWSQTSTKWQPRDAQKWDTFSGDQTGYQAVFKAAQDRGWVNPNSKAAKLPVAFTPGPHSGSASFPFRRASDLTSDRAPRAMVVDGLLPTDSVCAVFGNSGCGKTFVVMGWGCCVGTGTPWAGRDVKQGPVFLIVGEGHTGIGARLAAWERETGVPLDDAPLFISEMAANLTDEECVALVVRGIHERLAETGSTHVALIIVDTLSRNFVGDENSSTDMAKFVRLLDVLRVEFKACIVVVHHTGHAESGRARGSSVLRAALDAEYLVARDGLHVTLKATKTKDWEAPPMLDFSLVVVPDEDGDASCVLRAWPDGEMLINGAPLPNTARLSAQQQKVMDLLRTMHADRGRQHPEGTDPAHVGVHEDELRIVLQNHGLVFDRRRWPELLQRLTDRQLIRREGSHVYLRA